MIGDILDKQGNRISDDINKGIAFNNYMNTMGDDIISRIPHYPHRSYREFMNPPRETTLSIHQLTIHQVGEHIMKLNPKKTQDLRGMSVFLLQQVAMDVAPALTHIFNLCIRTSIFPTKFKDSLLNPIYKNKGSREDLANYRGITLSDTFGKCFEKLISTQLINYLETNDIFYKFQYGFRRGSSTHHCLTSILDSITSGLNKKELVACLGLDVEKAFDCVSHEILLDKMDNIGIRGSELEFFKSYYSKRKQYIKINGKISDDFVTIPRSVLQGTILGVIGFLIFINDLPNATKYAENFIYADDLNCIFKAKTQGELQ